MMPLLPHQHTAPMPVYGVFDVEEMIHATSRLSDVLAEENDMLTAMRLKDLETLQAEKRSLTLQVESFQRMLAVDNSAVKEADPARRELLITLTDGLMTAIEKNLHLTRNAQYANQLVMQTIVEAMSMQHRVGTYGSQGKTKHEMGGITLSVNLNERA